jgi:hypothetical protein
MRGGCVKRASRELPNGPRNQLATLIYMHPSKRPGQANFSELYSTLYL